MLGLIARLTEDLKISSIIRAAVNKSDDVVNVVFLVQPVFTNHTLTARDKSPRDMTLNAWLPSHVLR